MSGLLSSCGAGLLIAVASPCRALALERGLQELLCPGLVAPWHVESYWTRDGLCNILVGRRILYY